MHRNFENPAHVVAAYFSRVHIGHTQKSEIIVEPERMEVFVAICRGNPFRPKRRFVFCMRFLRGRIKNTLINPLAEANGKGY